MCIGCHFYERKCEWKQSIRPFTAECSVARVHRYLVEKMVCMICKRLNRPHEIRFVSIMSAEACRHAENDKENNRGVYVSFTCANVRCRAVQWPRAIQAIFIKVKFYLLLLFEEMGREKRRTKEKLNGAKWNREQRAAINWFTINYIDTPSDAAAVRQHSRGRGRWSSKRRGKRLKRLAADEWVSCCRMRFFVLFVFFVRRRSVLIAFTWYFYFKNM